MMTNRFPITWRSRRTNIRAILIGLVSLSSIYGCKFPNISDPKCINLDVKSYSSKGILSMLEDGGWNVRSTDADRGCVASYHVQIIATQAPLGGGFTVYTASSTIIDISDSTHPTIYMAHGPTYNFPIEYVVGRLLEDLEDRADGQASS